jgi:GNAT superfamily N-acetyltransferase
VGPPEPPSRSVPPTADQAVPALRRAVAADAEVIAQIHLAAFRATYRFPLAHADDEVSAWVAEHLLPETETWVAEVDGAVVAFCSLGPGWVEQLYVTPGHTGRGIGSRLVVLAKERQPAGLQLWTFQVNGGARRFYERHGFRAVEMTDGAGNEERQPDVRYAWR